MRMLIHEVLLSICLQTRSQPKPCRSLGQGRSFVHRAAFCYSQKLERYWIRWWNTAGYTGMTYFQKLYRLILMEKPFLVMEPFFLIPWLESPTHGQ